MTRISESTVRRLSHYYRLLEEVEAEGGRLISSHRLAEREGVTSAQVRKDLSYLGTYGTRGVGYDVQLLIEQISRELGLTRDWAVAIVGFGNLGHALANYKGFAEITATSDSTCRIEWNVGSTSSGICATSISSSSDSARLPVRTRGAESGNRSTSTRTKTYS